MSVNVGIRCKSVTEEAVAKRPDPADHNKRSHQPPGPHFFLFCCHPLLNKKKIPDPSYDDNLTPVSIYKYTILERKKKVQCT